MPVSIVYPKYRARYFLLSLCVAAASLAGCQGAAPSTIPSSAAAAVPNSPGAAVANSSAFAIADSATATATVGWPETYHDGGHTGYNPSETHLSTSNVPQLHFVAAGSTSGGVTAFALAGGNLFAQSNGASNGSVITSLNATTMHQRWAVTSGGSFNAPTIAAANGLVIAACRLGSNAYDGICAYHESSGALAWKFDSATPGSTLATPPTYSAGVVYFGYAYSAGTNVNGNIVALNATTGAPVYNVFVGNANWLAGNAPAVGGGNVYYSCYPSGAIIGVCAFNSSGHAVWQHSTGTNQNALSFANGLVFDHFTGGPSGNATGVLALNDSSGNLVHSYPYCPQGCGNGPQPAAIAKGVLYVSGLDGHLYAYHVSTGAHLWTAGSVVSSSPSVANGVVYVLHSDPNAPVVTAYNASSGAALWNSPNYGRTLNPPPVIAGGVLYSAGTTCGSICSYTAP